jgi:hypothetical protein
MLLLRAVSVFGVKKKSVSFSFKLLRCDGEIEEAVDIPEEAVADDKDVGDVDVERWRSAPWLSGFVRRASLNRCESKGAVVDEERQFIDFFTHFSKQLEKHLPFAGIFEGVHGEEEVRHGIGWMKRHLAPNGQIPVVV